MFGNVSKIEAFLFYIHLRKIFDCYFNVDLSSYLTIYMIYFHTRYYLSVFGNMHSSLFFNLFSRNFPMNEHVLQAFSLYVQTEDNIYSKDDALKILESIKENLNSPYKLHRLLALNIFQGLNGEVSAGNEDDNVSKIIQN